MRTHDPKPVYVGIHGTVLALDRSNGQELWRTPLKGGDFVNLVLDGPDLYATARGELFCLDPATGRVRWNNRLKGMGYGFVTIATPSGSMVPAIARAQADAAARQDGGNGD